MNILHVIALACPYAGEFIKMVLGVGSLLMLAALVGLMAGAA